MKRSSSSPSLIKGPFLDKYGVEVGVYDNSRWHDGSRIQGIKVDQLIDCLRTPQVIMNAPPDSKDNSTRRFWYYGQPASAGSNERLVCEVTYYGGHGKVTAWLIDKVRLDDPDRNTATHLRWNLQEVSAKQEEEEQKAWLLNQRRASMLGRSSQVLDSQPMSATNSAPTGSTSGNPRCNHGFIGEGPYSMVCKDTPLGEIRLSEGLWKECCRYQQGLPYYQEQVKALITSGKCTLFHVFHARSGDRGTGDGEYGTCADPKWLLEAIQSGETAHCLFSVTVNQQELEVVVHYCQGAPYGVVAAIVLRTSNIVLPTNMPDRRQIEVRWDPWHWSEHLVKHPNIGIFYMRRCFDNLIHRPNLIVQDEKRRKVERQYGSATGYLYNLECSEALMDEVLPDEAGLRRIIRLVLEYTHDVEGGFYARVRSAHTRATNLKGEISKGNLVWRLV
ncbi:MAG TPA: hypothetical protein VF826_02530 [Chloroflexia bacterium]|jgi:hypothetical protein